MSPSRGTNRALRPIAINILLATAMMPAFAQTGPPATAANHSQTAAQGTSSKNSGVTAASKNAAAQSNASTNPQSANQENDSPNTGSNNPGIAPAGWVPQTQNQQMRPGGNRTTIPNPRGSKPAAKPDSKEKKPANDDTR
jgi:hypothetical protein